MSHALLALTLAATLLLNGSMALATMPTPCAPPGTGVCAVPRWRRWAGTRIPARFHGRFPPILSVWAKP